MTPSITATVWGSGWERLAASQHLAKLAVPDRDVDTATVGCSQSYGTARVEGGAADQIDFAAVSDVVAPPSQTTVLPKHHGLPGEDTIQAMSRSVDTWAVDVFWPERDAIVLREP